MLRHAAGNSDITRVHCRGRRTDVHAAARLVDTLSTRNRHSAATTRKTFASHQNGTAAVTNSRQAGLKSQHATSTRLLRFASADRHRSASATGAQTAIQSKTSAGGARASTQRHQAASAAIRAGAARHDLHIASCRERLPARYQHFPRRSRWATATGHRHISRLDHGVSGRHHHRTGPRRVGR